MKGERGGSKELVDVTTLVVAFLAMMGSGGVAVALTNAWLQRRKEGVEHTPGEVVFNEMRTAIADLRVENKQLKDWSQERDKLVVAQAQQLATLGEEVRQMRESAIVREERITELKGELLAAKRANDELEFELNEERTARAKLQEQVTKMSTELRELRYTTTGGGAE